MARKTIRIDVPIGRPDEFLKLASSVSEKNKSEGDDSPLSGLNMRRFNTNLAIAAEKRAQAKKLEAEAQVLHAEAAELIGSGPGQTSQTTNTLYWFLCNIRDVLLGANRGNERALELWGFRVVIGTASAPRKPAELNS